MNTLEHSIQPTNSEFASTCAGRGIRVPLRELAALHDDHLAPIAAWARTRLREVHGRNVTTYLSPGFLTHYSHATFLDPGQLYLQLWERLNVGECHLSVIDDLALPPTGDSAPPAGMPAPGQLLPSERVPQPALKWGHELLELALTADGRAGDDGATRAAAARRDAVVSTINGLCTLGRDNDAARLATAWWNIADLPGIGAEDGIWLDNLASATEHIRAADLPLRCELAQAAGDATYRLGEHHYAYRHWHSGAHDGYNHGAALPLLQRLLAFTLATPHPDTPHTPWTYPSDRDPREPLINMISTYAALGDPLGEGWALTRIGLLNLTRHQHAHEDFSQAGMLLRAAGDTRYGTPNVDVTYTDITVLLGHAAWHQGHHTRARAHWQHALTQPDTTSTAHIHTLLALPDTTRHLPLHPHTEPILGGPTARTHLHALTSRPNNSTPESVSSSNRAADTTACTHWST